MSERQEIAERIAEVIKAKELDSPFGGDVLLSRNGRPHYSVGFSTPRFLDGTVSVYSPKFIQVRYRTSYRALPEGGSHIFKSEETAIKFITLAFANLDFDSAMNLVE